MKLILGGIPFHLYGLLIGLGIFVGYEMSLWAAGKLKVKVKVENGFLWALIPGLIGARLYHVIDLWNEVYRYDWLQIIRVWEGGLGIWGAVMGGILGLIVFSWFKKISVLTILDVGVIGVPLAQAIGRWGNYFNNELLGKNGEPLFFYESILDLGLFWILVLMIKKGIRNDGKIFGTYLVGYGLIRFGLEPLREPEIIWTLKGMPVAMILSVLAIVLGTVILVKKNPQVKN